MGNLVESLRGFWIARAPREQGVACFPLGARSGPHRRAERQCVKTLAALRHEAGAAGFLAPGGANLPPGGKALRPRSKRRLEPCPSLGRALVPKPPEARGAGAKTKHQAPAYANPEGEGGVSLQGPAVRVFLVKEGDSFDEKNLSLRAATWVAPGQRLPGRWPIRLGLFVGLAGCGYSEKTSRESRPWERGGSISLGGGPRSGWTTDPGP